MASDAWVAWTLMFQRIGELRRYGHPEALCDKAGQGFVDLGQQPDQPLPNGGCFHLVRLKSQRLHDVRSLGMGLAPPTQRGLTEVIEELFAPCAYFQSGFKFSA